MIEVMDLGSDGASKYLADPNRFMSRRSQFRKWSISHISKNFGGGPRDKGMVSTIHLTSLHCARVP
jgi:hypothetical protein